MFASSARSSPRVDYSTDNRRFEFPHGERLFTVGDEDHDDNEDPRDPRGAPILAVEAPSSASISASNSAAVQLSNVDTSPQQEGHLVVNLPEDPRGASHRLPHQASMADSGIEGDDEAEQPAEPLVSVHVPPAVYEVRGQFSFLFLFYEPNLEA